MNTISNLGQAEKVPSPEPSKRASSRESFKKMMEKRHSSASEETDENLFNLVARLEEAKAIEEEEKKKKGLMASQALSSLPLALISSAALHTDMVSGALSANEAALLEFFENLVITVQKLDEAGISETTITLNEERFPLFGNTQIQITEYATAPKAFNIQLLTSPQAGQLLQEHVSEFLQAFEGKKERFKIHRIDISLRGKEKHPTPGEKQHQLEDSTV